MLIMLLYAMEELMDMPIFFRVSSGFTFRYSVSTFRKIWGFTS